MVDDAAVTTPEVTIFVHSGQPESRDDRCLRSIRESAEGSSVSAEVIQLENGESLTTRLNRAGLNARGVFLCFVNGSSIVPAGWLPMVIRAFESIPRVGAVGPLLLDDADRVRFGGAVLGSDGSVRVLAVGLSLKDRRTLHVNDVDAVSSDFLMMRTELFRQLGGFANDYRTVAYRDADLCLAIRHRNLRIVVDPRIQVFQAVDSDDRQTPAGSATDDDADREHLSAKWSERLREQPDGSVPLDTVRVAAREAVIACHYPRTPTWDQDSGALRISTLLVELARRGYHVVLVCPSEMNPYLADLHAAGIETVQAWWGGDSDCVRMIQAYHPRAVIFTHAESESRFGKSYEVFSPDTIRLSDTVDLHFLRERRRLAAANGLAGEPRISVGTLGTDGLEELSSALRSDVTLVVSQYERNLLIESLFLDPDRVRIVSNVHEPSAHRAPFEPRAGFAFLGGYNHPPNVDSILWIAEHVWPLIRASLPSAELRIYGSAMPDRVKALHDLSNRIDAIGFVADHREALGQARVMLSPLTYGAGVKGKIGEALAAGTPVVTNRIGAEGMDETGRALAIAEDPADLARWAVRLHEDPHEWARRSDAGVAVLAEKFSAAANLDQLLTAIDDARQWREQPSFWNLVRQVLWHERGCPGKPHDFGRAIDLLARQSEHHADLIEHYRAALDRLRENEAQLRLELAQSTGARRELLRRLESGPSSNA